MKKPLSILFLFLLTSLVFGAPFGLKMGMTLDEIAAACNGEKPVFLEADRYLIKPAKRHPIFEHYMVCVNENTGLYQIKAVSSSVATNKYGTELQNAFYAAKDRIAKTYGQPTLIDEVDTNIEKMYQQNDYWFYTLSEGSRVLTAVWDNEHLADNLKTVALECVSKSGFYSGTGYLVLHYYFINVNNVEDDQDSVF